MAKEKSRKSIILLGGSLYNKGCQAMILTAVDRLRRRWPDARFLLFSWIDFQRDPEEKRRWRFSILPWDLEIKLWLLHPLGKYLRGMRKRHHSKDTVERIRQEIRNADAIIETSGFSLSSQWPLRVSFQYLLNIMIARKYRVPFYTLPQSIGPFAYPLLPRLVLGPLLRSCLKYPTRIYAREEEGHRLLLDFTRENVHPYKTYDVVLTHTGYRKENIFAETVPSETLAMASHSVGIIPNLQVFLRTDKEKLFILYHRMIELLLKSGKSITLIAHAFHQDFEPASTIKKGYSASPDVHLLPDDLDVIAMEKVIQQFEFIITARYHALVHAYKNAVPAVAIGWADKYTALMRDFEQEDFLVDIRKPWEEEELIPRLKRMLEDWPQQKIRIRNHLQALPAENIFSFSTFLE